MMSLIVSVVSFLWYISDIFMCVDIHIFLGPVAADSCSPTDLYMYTDTSNWYRNKRDEDMYQRNRVIEEINMTEYCGILKKIYKITGKLVYISQLLLFTV